MIKFGEIYINYGENITYTEYYELLFGFNEISINEGTSMIISFGDENNYDMDKILNIFKCKFIGLVMDKVNTLPKQIEINKKIINYVNPKFSKENGLTLNFKNIYKSNINYNIKNALPSKYNCIYNYENKNVFSIVKKKKIKQFKSNILFCLGF